MENQENQELNQPSAPADTGDGSQPAGSQVVADQARAAADQAQAAADQAQAAADQADGQAQAVADQVQVVADQVQAVADQEQAAAEQDQAGNGSQTTRRSSPAFGQDQGGSQDQETHKLSEQEMLAAIETDFYRKGYDNGLADGKAIKDHAADQGGNRDLIGQFAETLTKVIKSENQQQSKVFTDLLGISVDQQSDIIEILNNLTETIRQDRANNEIIKQNVLMISNTVVELTKTNNDIVSLLKEIYELVTPPK